MRPDDFLKYSALHYEELKKKWKVRLTKLDLKFSEDIYNSTILNVYDILKRHEIEDNNIEGFFYKSFLNNTRREKEYAYNTKRDTEIDVLEYLDNFPNEDKPILLEDIEGFKKLSEVDKNLFLIYYSTSITYKELEELTEIKDIKYRLKKIIKKIKESK